MKKKSRVPSSTKVEPLEPEMLAMGTLGPTAGVLMVGFVLGLLWLMVRSFAPMPDATAGLIDANGSVTWEGIDVWRYYTRSSWWIARCFSVVAVLSVGFHCWIFVHKLVGGPDRRLPAAGLIWTVVVTLPFFIFLWSWSPPATTGQTWAILPDHLETPIGKISYNEMTVLHVKHNYGGGAGKKRGGGLGGKLGTDLTLVVFMKSGETREINAPFDMGFGWANSISEQEKAKRLWKLTLEKFAPNLKVTYEIGQNGTQTLNPGAASKKKT